MTPTALDFLLRLVAVLVALAAWDGAKALFRRWRRWRSSTALARALRKHRPLGRRLFGGDGAR